MATRADVRRIAMDLPGTVAGVDRFAFSVMRKGKAKGFVWVWMERVHPKKPRVPNNSVIACRVANLAEKQALIDRDPSKFFTEPHYEGFPAVLIRLPAITARELKPLVADAWRTMASKDLLLTAASRRTSPRSRSRRKTSSL